MIHIWALPEWQRSYLCMIKIFYSSNYPEDMVHYKVMRYETGTVPFGTGEDMH